jgi:polyisoprenoid-binding protein YceI
MTGTFLLGPDSGRVLIKTGRAGLAAKVGHDLTIEITRWSARVTVPAAGDGDAAGAGGVPAASVTADLDLGSLTVRQGTGGAKPLSDRDRREIENTARKILGHGAQATAVFTSTRVIASGDAAGAMEGTVTLNGRSRAVRLQLASTAEGRYRGTVAIKQTDFGITPYTGFFGALKLRDEIGVEFEADLNRAARE